MVLALCTSSNDDWYIWSFLILIVLEFNDASTLVGHFVSSHREKEKEEIEEEIKEKDREERTGMKVKK